jgi:hypothetical protein
VTGATGALAVLLELAGFAAVAYGLWQLWEPSAYIVGGAAAVLAAQALGRR